MTVLVVEDVVEQCELIRSVVEHALSRSALTGRVFSALRLTEARVMIGRHRPHMVFLDITLGLESGLDLLPELLAAGIPVWILSAQKWPDERSLPPGVRGIWLKPEGGQLESSIESMIHALGLRGSR